MRVRPNSVPGPRGLGLCICCALLCARAYAPIYGLYPGLDSLERQSAAIAVIELLPRKPAPDPLRFDRKTGAWSYDPNDAEWSPVGLHWPHPVRVKSVLKGDLAEGLTTMSLRFLSVHASDRITEVPPAAFDFFAGGRPEYGCYIAFLQRDESSTSVSAKWANLNVQGGLLAVRCTADFSRRPGETPVDCIRRLVGAKRSP